VNVLRCCRPTAAAARHNQWIMISDGKRLRGASDSLLTEDIFIGTT
jgi:hypothetical protein